MAAVHKLVFPDDLESQEGAFMHFRISQSYKFKREKIDDKEVYATVTLPLPAALSTSYAANYSSEGLGMIGNAAADNAPAVLAKINAAASSIASGGGIGALKTIGSDIGNTLDLKKIAGDLARYYGPELAKEGGAAIGAAMQGAAGAAVGAAVGEAVKGAQVGLGVARNPYLAAAFEGVGFKSHSFNFQLAPKNQNESDTLAKLISAFRNAMIPGGGAVQQFYDYPQQIDIIFSDETYLFDIKTSVLTAFEVNYHGKGAYYHDVNGKKAPVEVTISMNFLETTVRLGGDETGDSAKFQIMSPKAGRTSGTAKLNAEKDLGGPGQGLIIEINPNPSGLQGRN
jgi:hypothetical protein